MGQCVHSNGIRGAVMTDIRMSSMCMCMCTCVRMWHGGVVPEKGMLYCLKTYIMPMSMYVYVYVNEKTRCKWYTAVGG
jgi:hypothetical protein